MHLCKVAEKRALVMSAVTAVVHASGLRRLFLGVALKQAGNAVRAVLHLRLGALPELLLSLARPEIPARPVHVHGAKARHPGSEWPVPAR